MGSSRKNPNRGWVGGWGYTFLKHPPGIFHFFTLTLEILDKTKLNPWMLHKIVLDPLEIPIQGQKQRPLEIPHYFFLVTLGNSTLFLINTWKFDMLFLWYLLEIPYPQPPPPPLPVRIFSRIAQYSSQTWGVQPQPKYSNTHPSLPAKNVNFPQVPPYQVKIALAFLL